MQDCLPCRCLTKGWRLSKHTMQHTLQHMMQHMMQRMARMLQRVHLRAQVRVQQAASIKGPKPACPSPRNRRQPRSRQLTSQLTPSSQARPLPLPIPRCLGPRVALL